MYKISILANHDLNTGSLDYYASIVPMIGDIIRLSSGYYEVKKRTLFHDNPNFIIIEIK